MRTRSVSLALATLAACSSTVVDAPPDAPPADVATIDAQAFDAGGDAVVDDFLDAASDAVEASSDAAADLAIDVPADIAIDASLDARADAAAIDARADVAAIDVRGDVLLDAPLDVRADVIVDAGDASVDGASALPSFCDAYPPRSSTGTWQSTRVRYDATGRLVYTADAQGNRIPDFSFAGYHQGEREIPRVAEVERVSPGAGDDTARIQAALDRVAARPLSADGLRGAVALAPGLYEIAGTLYVRASGVVLRGAGSGADPATSTILRAPGDTPHQRDVIVLGPGDVNLRRLLVAPSHNVTTARVVVNQSAIDLDDVTGLSVGDAVMLTRPSTSAWIAALGGGGGSSPWNPGEVDTAYLRHVTAISGRRVTLDVPVYDTLDRAVSQSAVSRVDMRRVAREVGVESLRVDIQTAGGADENHALNAVNVSGTRDAWVRDVTALHFVYAAVAVEQSQRVTVARCQGLDPVAMITGGRMYNFAADDQAQQVLFVDCAATNGRHHYVSNGTSSVSDVVFLRGRSTGAHASMEGHRRWTQALLYDSIVERTPNTDTVVGLYNRGDYGTFHGWAAVHSVLWRQDTGGGTAIVQRPPLGQNYAIGVTGTVTGNGPFAGPAGFIETMRGTLTPASLYEAQLCDRLRR
ncbi:MAG: hypothetical protein U0326_24270 [Polyangiales bacterium]